jgi:hypothetical protein
MLDDLRHIKSATPELREFGATMAAILIVLGDIALLRGRAIALYLVGSGAALGVLGLAAPAVLRPLQKVWMGLGIVLGFFVSRVILSILFYIIITPIGLMMKLAGKDLLDERIDERRASYWRNRALEVRSKESYENQY